MTLAPEATERLMTPGEVAAMFRVDPKTVTRWAAAGRIGSIRTPGGHRRFRESEVLEWLERRRIGPGPAEEVAPVPNQSPDPGRSLTVAPVPIVGGGSDAS